MLIVLLTFAFLCSAANGVRVGTPCSSHSFCNYDGPEPMYHTKCDSEKGNTCQCTSLYYGETNDTECVKANFGDDCSNKTDPDTYCGTACSRSRCMSNSANQSICACQTSYYQSLNRDSEDICLEIEIGTPCNATGTGDSFCRDSIANAKCDVKKNKCTCPDGQAYVTYDRLCQPKSYVPECDTCRNTNGVCYDVESDGSASGCACPPSKASSAGNDSAALTVGCDLNLVQIGRRCDLTRSHIRCATDYSVCTHAGQVDDRFHCSCAPGYAPIPDKHDEKKIHCYPSLSKYTDQNCAWCQDRGGHCYDVDGDDVRDGCLCPASKTSTDPHDPTKECDTAHVNVACTANDMILCYYPHDTPRYPAMGELLANGDGYVFISEHLGQDPCIFEYTNETGRGDWCLVLDLSFDSAIGSPCGVTRTHPEQYVINYENGMILQAGRERSNDDIYFHIFCTYNSLVHAFSDSGAYVRGFANVASKGQAIKPTLQLNVYDEFTRDASLQGIRLGEPASLEVVMTEDENIYTAIRAEVCIASNRPELSNPDTETILLLFDGCPAPDSYLDTRNTFENDPQDLTVVRTGLFPIFKFVWTNTIFFHCAVRVCRAAADCAPIDCSSASRKKRADGLLREDSADPMLSRVSRSIGQDEHAVESIQSQPIRVLDNYEDETHDKENGRKPVTGTGVKNFSPLLIAGIGGVVLFVLILLGVAVFHRIRKSKSRSKKGSRLPSVVFNENYHH